MRVKAIKDFFWYLQPHDALFFKGEIYDIENNGDGTISIYGHDGKKHLMFSHKVIEYFNIIN